MNTKKTKYMLRVHCQNAWQNHIKTANKSFKNMAKLRYLEVTQQISFWINKSRLNLGVPTSTQFRILCFYYLKTEIKICCQRIERSLWNDDTHSVKHFLYILPVRYLSSMMKLNSTAFRVSVEVENTSCSIASLKWLVMQELLLNTFPYPLDIHIGTNCGYYI